MIIRADARALPLVDRCVQCAVTSPPYFGLRDYGHVGQIGLEATPAAYVATLVQVFRDVRRVLKDDGTVWLNLGDSYNAYNTNRGPLASLSARVEQAMPTVVGGLLRARRAVSSADCGDDAHGSGRDSAGRAGAGIQALESRLGDGSRKNKDLLGIPWRVAFALQADGWYLRSDIIWSKPNPMPESVTDRPTKAHEYLFLLSKQENYFYDADAIRERAVKVGTIGHLAGGSGVRAGSRAGLRRDEWIARKRLQPGSQALGHNEVLGDPLSSASHIDDDLVVVAPSAPNGWDSGDLDGRNKRSVWTIPTMPYAGAHFATMPEALVEPCILAGCPLGGLVLDPFLGSGTVGAVAERLGRRWVGTDLSYQPLSSARTAQRGIRFEAGDVA